ncbi:hypothetical protein PT974_05150 [Cladobotryum mycophilum]|uniref:Uncharacterized protein n=1 Tax=Cladobotryum mycophilum TaxID=491253 RepID=A0ABR0SSG4_9HYPO
MWHSLPPPTKITYKNPSSSSSRVDELGIIKHQAPNTQASIKTTCNPEQLDPTQSSALTNLQPNHASKMLTEIILAIMQASGGALAFPPPPIQPPSTFHPGVLPPTIPIHLFLSLDGTLHSFDHSGTEIRVQKLTPSEYSAARGTSIPLKSQKPNAPDEGVCSPLCTARTARPAARPARRAPTSDSSPMESACSLRVARTEVAFDNVSVKVF